jgi:hypothetical protein
MNRRIQELMAQCEDHGTWDNRTYTFDKDKFAQLLVAECAYTARQCYTVRGVDAEDVALHIEATLGSKQ